MQISRSVTITVHFAQFQNLLRGWLEFLQSDACFCQEESIIGRERCDICLSKPGWNYCISLFTQFSRDAWIIILRSGKNPGGHYPHPLYWPSDIPFVIFGIEFSNYSLTMLSGDKCDVPGIYWSFGCDHEDAILFSVGDEFPPCQTCNRLNKWLLRVIQPSFLPSSIPNDSVAKNAI